MAKTKKKNVGPTQVHASAQIQSQHAQTGIQEVYAPKNRDPDIE